MLKLYTLKTAFKGLFFVQQETGDATVDAEAKQEDGAEAKTNDEEEREEFEGSLA